MESWLESLLEAAGDRPGFLEYLILGLASGLEYVVPVIPGDVIVLGGAVFVGAKGWSLPLFFLTVNLSAVAGFSVDYLFGRWVEKHDAGWRERFPRWRRMGRAVDRVRMSFRRWGAIFIVCNRFLPAIRAAFFVAAGMADVPYWKVVLWGLVSSVAWNGLIFLVGWSVGYHRDELFTFFRNYSYAAWAVVGIAVVVLWARWRIRSR